MPSNSHSEKHDIRIGVDSGGTFTDITVYDETSGEILIWKVSSTPDDPSRGIHGGAAEAVQRFFGGKAHVTSFGHGTTVATNAVIQKRGSITGLLTTDGFRDVLEIARQTRASLYNLKIRRPQPLARRDHRLGIIERMRSDGTVQTPLDEESVRIAARRLKADGVEAVAVCLLNSYRNAAHEQRIGALLREELPGTFISLSTDIAPEYREFERSSTVVLNAYVGPLMQRYLQRLSDRLREGGIAEKPTLTQSNGGVISFEQAQAQPVRTILSGPAAGVVGATAIAGLAGYPDIITFDMGGTSTDVALIEGAAPRIAVDAEVHGYPIRVPMLDIETVGAGGGSLADVDAGGLIEVGPASAGAFPGPVCYELGNERPTVTDANVVLQVLNPVSLLAGRMPISQDASRRAIATLGKNLGLGVLEAAQGIVNMAIANMVRAVRVISVERGYDPRDFTLFAFGGAGPIHATRLARELGIARVLVPRSPGVLCALGLLLSDLKSTFSATRLCTLAEVQAAEMTAGFDEVVARCTAWFDAEDVAEERRSIRLSVDMRYAGQGHELNVPAGSALDIPALRAGFERIHTQMYGYTVPEEPIQITTFRAEAVASVAKAPIRAFPPASGPVSDAILTTREVYLPELGGFTPAPVYDRDRLGPGHVIAGPAIVEQMDSTTLILAGQTATVDPYLNLIVEG